MFPEWSLSPSSSTGAITVSLRVNHWPSASESGLRSVFDQADRHVSTRSPEYQFFQGLLPVLQVQAG